MLKRHINAWDTYKKIHDLEETGFTNEQIAKMLGYNTVTALKYARAASKKYVDDDILYEIASLRGAGYTFKEIAEELGSTEDNVKNKYYYRLRKENNAENL